MPEIDFDIEGARKAGASNKDISDYFKSKYNVDFDFDGASKEGAKDSDILGYINDKYGSKKKESTPSPYLDGSLPQNAIDINNPFKGMGTKEETVPLFGGNQYGKNVAESTLPKTRDVAKELETDTRGKKITSDAIKNTVTSYKNRISGDGIYNISDNDPSLLNQQKQLESQLKDGSLQVVKNPKTGNYILARKNDALQSFQQAWDDVKEKAADDKYVAGLTTEEKVKHYDNKAAVVKDEYLPSAPSGLGGAFGNLIGENLDPLVKISAGAMASGKIGQTLGLTGEALANSQKFGSFLSFATDAGYSGYANNTERVYNALRKQDPNGDKIEQMKHAETAGLLGEASELGLAAGMTGAFPRLNKAAQQINVQPLVKSFEQLAKHTVQESATQGTMAAGSSIASDLGAISQGMKMTPSEVGANALEKGKGMAEFAAIMGAGMGIVAGLGNVPKYVKAQATGTLAKIDPTIVADAYKEAENSGALPEGTTDKAMAQINSFKEAQSKVPNDLPDENVNAIAGIQQKIDKLEAQKKTLAPQFHERLDAVIESLQERAKKIASTNRPLEHEVDDLTQQKTTVKNEPIEENETTEIPTKDELTPTIVVEGKEYTGDNHGEAMNNAIADGKNIPDKDTVEGKKWRTENGMFKDRSGDLLTREQTKKIYGITNSEELLPKEKTSEKQATEIQQPTEVEKPTTEKVSETIKPTEEGEFTKESVTKMTNINHPFAKKVKAKLVELGLMSEDDNVEAYVQPLGKDGGWSVGKIKFDTDGTIKYIDSNGVIEFDKDGNVLSSDIKSKGEREVIGLNEKINDNNDTIKNFEEKINSEDLKYKTVDVTDPFGRKIGEKKVFKTDAELKASKDKLKEIIDKKKKENEALKEQIGNHPDKEVLNEKPKESTPTIKEEVVKPLEHKANIHNKFREVFESKGIPKEQVDAAIALMEARAKSWASEEKGRNADDWYDKISDVSNGDFQSDKILYQDKEGKKTNVVRLYHSTTSPISGDFRVKGKNNSHGIFFAAKKAYSKVFGDITYKVKIEPKNTLVLNDNEVARTPFFNIKENELKDYLDKGYDSIAWNKGGKLQEFIVLDNSIIKDRDIVYQKNKGEAKGAVETLADGKKVIHALDAPDFSTMVHEIGHVFESDLTDAEKKIVKDFGGSEPFARGFEKYLRDGKAPNKELQTLFDKFKDWLTNIYQTLKGSPIAKKISPEIKDIFDRLLTEKQTPKEEVKGEIKTETPKVEEKIEEPTKQIKINDLVDRVQQLQKLRANDPKRAKEVNDVKLAAKELGLEYKDDFGKLFNPKGTEIQKREPITNKTVVKDFDRKSYSKETNDAVDFIVDNEHGVTGFNIRGTDGKRLSAKQRADALKSIKEGKPNYAAKAVFDFIEQAHEKGGIELEDVTSGKRDIVSIKEYFDNIKTEEDKINDYLKSKGEEELDIPEEHINNLIEQYETEFKAENQQPTSESEGNVSKETSTGTSTKENGKENTKLETPKIEEKPQKENKEPPIEPPTENQVDNEMFDEEGTHIRMSMLSDAKNVFRKLGNTWNDFAESGMKALSNFAVENKSENLYEAAKTKVFNWYNEIQKGVKLNPTTDERIQLGYFRSSTRGAMKDIVDSGRMDSSIEMERNSAINDFNALQSNLDVVDSVIGESSSESGKSFGLLNAIFTSDKDALLTVELGKVKATIAPIVNEIIRNENAKKNPNTEKIKAAKNMQLQAEADVERIFNEEQKINKAIDAETEKISNERFEQRVKEEVEKRLKEAKKTTGAKLSVEKSKEVANKLRSAADKIENFMKAKGSEGADIQGIDVQKKIADAIRYIADKIESGDIPDLLAAAINKFGKDEKDFKKELIKQLGDAGIEKELLEGKTSKEKTIDKINNIAQNEGSKSLTKSMVEKGLIQDLVNSHLDEGYNYNEVLDVVTGELQKTLPDVTREQVRDAFLKENGFELPTTEQVNKQRTKESLNLKKLEGLKKKLEELKKGHEAFIEQKGSINPKTENEIDNINKEIEKELLRQGIQIESGSSESIAQSSSRIGTHNSRVLAFKNKITELLNDNPDNKLYQQIKETLDKAIIPVKDIMNKLKPNQDLLDKSIKKIMGLKGIKELNRMSLPPELKSIKDGLNNIINEHNSEKTKNELELQVDKTIKNLESSIKSLDKKIKLKLTDDTPFKQKATNSKIVQLEVEKREKKKEYARIAQKIKYSNKNLYEKALDFGSVLYLGDLISGWTTTAAVAVSGATKPILESATRGTAAVVSKIVPRLFENLSYGAGSEGAYKYYFTQEKARYKAIFNRLTPEQVSENIKKAGDRLNEANGEYNLNLQKAKELKDAGLEDEYNSFVKNELSKSLNKSNKALIESFIPQLQLFVGSDSFEDVFNILFKGASELEAKMGYKEVDDFSELSTYEKTVFVLGTMGRVHSVLKNFSARGEFAAGFISRLENRMKTDPESINKVSTLIEVGDEAMQDFNRGKYQTKNFLNDLMKGLANVSHDLSEKNPNNKLYSSADKAFSALLKMQFPVTKTPLNILDEAVTEYWFGALKGGVMQLAENYKGAGGVKGISEWIKGSKDFAEMREQMKEHIKNMPKDRKDMILRAYRKGGFVLMLKALGLATYLTYGGTKQLGSPKKKEKEDKDYEKLPLKDKLGYGQVAIGNIMANDFFSHVITHASILYPFISQQDYAAAKERELARGKGELESTLKARLFQTRVVIEKIPYTKEISPFSTKMQAPTPFPFGRMIEQTGEGVEKYILGNKAERKADTWLERMELKTGVLRGNVGYKEGVDKIKEVDKYFNDQRKMARAKGNDLKVEYLSDKQEMFIKELKNAKTKVEAEQIIKNMKSSK